MAEPLPPTTLAWIHQSATVKGSTYSQVLLHLLERVEALEQRSIPGFVDLLERVEALEQRSIPGFVDLDAPTPEAAPVATDGELTTDGDSSQRQWYSYDPEDGIEIYSSGEQAQLAAKSIMGFYQEAAQSDGWHRDMELLSWGMLIPVEHAQIVARGFNEPGEEIEEWARYELKPAQPPAAPPAPEPGDQERLRIMAAGIRYGYISGHDDTVEGRYGDPDELAADEAPVILGELDATFESMLQQQAAPAPPAAPAGGLVERVAGAIADNDAPADLWFKDARAAILEVAAWMRENETGYNAARLLELEAER